MKFLNIILIELFDLSYDYIQEYELIYKRSCDNSKNQECRHYLVLSDMTTHFVIYLRAGLRKGQRSSSFGQNSRRSYNRSGSIPHGSDDLALGVEEKLWGDSLYLETLEGEGGCCRPSSQRGWIHKQWEGPYDL